MKKIILAGGSGFLGKRLANAFTAKGFSVIIVSRSGKSSVNGTAMPWEALPQLVDGAHAVINLAGTNVGGKRWGAQVRHDILESRISSTRLIVNAIREAKDRPAFISASAVGFYGNTMVPTNEAMGAGQTFLANVVSAWEKEVMVASDVTRVVCLRIGVVLDAKEGALPRLALPMKLGVGGPLGSGKQWFPWVHIDDVVEAFVWATLDAMASGPYNVVAPEAITMGQMSAALGKVLHRPSWLPVPSAALRLLLGRQADVVVHGQHVVPMRLLGTTFRFTHPHLDEALRDLLRNS